MTNHETFVLTIGYIAFILFILAVIGIGGVLTVKDQPYTATALEKVMENVKNATK